VRPTFFERAAQGFGLALALLIVPVVLAIEAVPSIWPPNGLTQAQYAFCHEEGWELVADAAWPQIKTPEYVPPWGFRDPSWAAACRYAYDQLGPKGGQPS
jgi:hypothetical protein